MRGTGLKRILSIFCILLLLSSVLYSEGLSPLEELKQILQSYVQTTSSLNDRQTLYEKSLANFEISQQVIKSDLQVLQSNWTKREQSLTNFEIIQVEQGKISISLQKITNDLQIGLQNMERKLAVYKVLNNILFCVAGATVTYIVVDKVFLK